MNNLSTAGRHVWMPRLALAARVAAACLTISPESYAQTEPFTGMWVSANETALNITRMESSGSFSTERLEGLTVVGTIKGRWRVRDNAIVWTYTEPRGDADDVNPIVSSGRDRFTLREADGSSSTFFRKGVVDPGSPDLLPVAVGTGWVFEDEGGEMAIRVSVRQMFAGQRWYARGVGLVQEEPTLPAAAGGQRMNLKRLKRRIE